MVKRKKTGKMNRKINKFKMYTKILSHLRISINKYWLIKHRSRELWNENWSMHFIFNRIEYFIFKYAQIKYLTLKVKKNYAHDKNKIKCILLKHELLPTNGVVNIIYCFSLILSSWNEKLFYPYLERKKKMNTKKKTTSVHLKGF